MAFLLLPTETVLHIFCHVSPDDVTSLQLSSRRFSNIILTNEQYICGAIAKAWGLSNNIQLAPAVKLVQETWSLQLLRTMWQRRKLVERVLPAIGHHSAIGKRSLELLWDYHHVLQAESRDTATDNYRQFVRSTKPEELTALMTTIRSCGYLILKHIKSIDHQSQRAHLSGRLASLKDVQWSADILAEIVVIKGLEFIVKVAIEMSLDSLIELEEWRKPRNKPAISRLTDEQKWQSKIALLKANALLSG